MARRMGIDLKQVVPAVDFSKWGPVKRQPMSALRKTIAQRMEDAWTSIPHVTLFDEADVTALLPLLKKKKFTLTAVTLKLLAPLLKKHAIVSASLDEAKQEIVFKDYVHIGVAVDTEQGLIVPVIRDVDRKNLTELSKELSGVAERARQRKLGADELQGGSFTVTNLGGIGGGSFTPIINKPQGAILGLGRAVEKPIAVKKKATLRFMLPMALSFDHRLMDGAQAARFFVEVRAAFESAKI
jgi:pyruvate dehydrogenase E2 component (dihydrolipoamide acetyltransferase)